MSDMRTKNLQLDRTSYQVIIDDIIKPYVDRVNAQNARLNNSNLDAPYFPAAISLGPENLPNNTSLKDKINQVYKINVPGYFYRQHYKGDWTSAGKAGVLVSGTPAGLSSSSSRMVYMAGSDSTIGHANNLFPILPGGPTQSGSKGGTYVYIVRNGSIRDNLVTKEWLFVPTVLGASINVHPDSYVSRVGKLQSDPDLTGVGLQMTAFSGDWKKNFKSICGWNVADEATITFTGTGEADFINERKAWITGLGADLKNQGYGN